MKSAIRKILKRILIDRKLSRKSSWGGVWNYIHGFKKETIEICGINKSNYKQFISDRDYLMGHPYNAPYSSIIDNKLWLPLFLNNYKQYLPTHFFFKDKQGFLNLRSTSNNIYREDISSFYKLLDEEGSIVLKHTHSSSGKGFYFVKKNEEQYYINNILIKQSDLTDIINNLDEYIVTEYVKQHSYSSSISSSSLNTFRLLTVWDNKSKTNFIARAFHKFGCSGSTIDNLSGGNGVLVFMDPEKGVLLGNGTININNSGNKYLENIVHPDNKISLKGIVIPNYEFVKNKILQITNEHSYLKYVGWDIAITEDGFKIIEANSRTTLETIQQREGFMTDSRIRKVLKR